MSGPPAHPAKTFLATVSSLRGGERVVTCYQCGTCSGSCPAIEAMDHSPRAIMHMIQMGREEAVLSSRTPWVCASCYACVVRCPREIEITDLMASLRRLAVERAVPSVRSTAFEHTFLDIVRRDGRMFELEMLLRYKLRSGPLDLIPLAPMGLAMLSHGQLGFRRHRIKGQKEMGEIFRRWEEWREAP